MSLSTWQPADRMRLYVRKDIAAQVWNYGAAPVAIEEMVADPYEGKGILLPAEKIIGTEGSSPGEFINPRNVAVAADGTLYVCDTGNHRIQLMRWLKMQQFGDRGRVASINVSSLGHMSHAAT